MCTRTCTELSVWRHAVRAHSQVPAEGEIKVALHIRENQALHALTHFIVGPDADLFIIGLLLSPPCNVYLYRRCFTYPIYGTDLQLGECSCACVCAQLCVC